MDEVRADVTARGGSLDLTGPGVRVEGDEVLLRQAFGNLCRNAVEACAEHGIVPAIHVEVRVNREHRQTLITIADNGPGVAPSRARPHVPAVFHDEGQGHRPRPGARPEDHRHPQRPHHAVAPGARRPPHGSRPPAGGIRRSLRDSPDHRTDQTSGLRDLRSA